VLGKGIKTDMMLWNAGKYAADLMAGGLFGRLSGRLALEMTFFIGRTHAVNMFADRLAP
jgi:hypothetical protein